MKVRGKSFIGILFIIVFIVVSSSFVFAESTFSVSAINEEINVCPTSQTSQLIYITNTHSSTQVFKVWQIGEGSKFSSLFQTEYVIGAKETAVVENLINLNSFDYGKYKLYTQVTSHNGEVMLLDQTIKLNKCKNSKISSTGVSYSNCPGKTSVYHLYIKNTGAFIDNYNVKLDIPNEYYTLSANNVLIAPGDTADVYVYLTMPSDTLGWTYPKATVTSIKAQSTSDIQLYLYSDPNCFDHNFEIINVTEEGETEARTVDINGTDYYLFCRDTSYFISYNIENTGDVDSRYQLYADFINYRKSYDIIYSPALKLDEKTKYLGELQLRVSPHNYLKNSSLKLEYFDENSEISKSVFIPFVAYDCPVNYTEEQFFEDYNNSFNWKTILLWLLIVFGVIVLVLIIIIVVRVFLAYLAKKREEEKLRPIVIVESKEDKDKLEGKKAEEAKEKPKEKIKEKSIEKKSLKKSEKLFEEDEDTENKEKNKFPWWILLIVLFIILLGLLIWWILPLGFNSILLYADSAVNVNGKTIESQGKVKVDVGYSIETLDSVGRVLFFNNINMKFDKETDFIIESYKDKEIRIKLGNGSVFVNYGKTSRVDSFIIESEDLITRVTGKQFDMNNDEVVVNEGSVDIFVKSNTDSFEVKSGQKLVKIQDNYYLMTMTEEEKALYELSNGVVFVEEDAGEAVGPVDLEDNVNQTEINDTVEVNDTIKINDTADANNETEGGKSAEDASQNSSFVNSMSSFAKYVDQYIFKYLLYIIVVVLIIVILFWVINWIIKTNKKSDKEKVDRDKAFKAFLLVVAVLLLLLVVIFFIITSFNSVYNLNPYNENGTIKEIDESLIKENATTYVWRKNTVKELNLDNLASDAENDQLSYISTEVRNITIRIEGHKAYMIPEKEWYGERYVNFIADDGRGGRGYSPDIRLVVLNKEPFYIEYIRNIESFFSTYLSYIVLLLFFVLISVIILIFFIVKRSDDNKSKGNKKDDENVKELPVIKAKKNNDSKAKVEESKERKGTIVKGKDSKVKTNNSKDSNVETIKRESPKKKAIYNAKSKSKIEKKKPSKAKTTKKKSSKKMPIKKNLAKSKK